MIFLLTIFFTKFFSKFTTHMKKLMFILLGFFYKIAAFAYSEFENDFKNLKNINITENDTLGYFIIKYKHFKTGEDLTKNLKFVLFQEKLPLTVKNFMQISKGVEYQNKIISYKNSIFHRIVKDFVVQGGDVLNNNGTGTFSIYNGQFKDENFIFKHKKGSLSMANRGPNTNGSQFFICIDNVSHLDNKHVVFGHIIGGEDVLHDLNSIKTQYGGRPESDVILEDVIFIEDKNVIKKLIILNEKNEL